MGNEKKKPLTKIKNSLDENLLSKVWEKSNIYIQTGNNAIQSLLQFIVTINLAYIVAIYWFTTNSIKSLNDNYFLISSGIILIVNLTLFVIYIRHHRAISESIDQMNNIIKTYDNKLFDKSEHPDWYIFHDGNKDNYKGIVHFIIKLLLMFFILIPFFLIFRYLELQLFLPLAIIMLSLLIFYSLIDFNKKIKIKIEISLIHKLILLIVFLLLISYIIYLFNQIP